MEAVLLRPPLPSIVGLLIVSGTAIAGLQLARLLRVEDDQPLMLAAGFVIATAILCAAVHAVAWIGIPRLWLCLRMLGWGLAVLGLVGIWRFIQSMRAAAPALRRYRQADRLTRLSAALVVLSLFAYLIGALGPATDADSLDYHLGVPLDWLIHGGAYARLDWLHARIVGLGEMVNLLGLASGTDCLGALFQFAGLVVAGIAVSTVAESDRNRLFGWLLVVGAPVMLSLVFAQKPQLLPAGATTLAIVMLVERWERLDTTAMWFAFAAVAFALSCKLNFLLSGAVVFAVGILAAQQAGRLGGAIAIAAAVLLLFPFPLWARNFCFYHDPISPLLERFQANPDSDVVDFAVYLRSCCFESFRSRMLLLPARLIGAVPPGAISSALGIGTLAFVLALRSGGSRILIAAAGIAALMTLALSQLSPRFFLEPYLWCAAAAVGCRDGRLKRSLHVAIAAQCAIVAVLALYGAAELSPAIFSPRGRVMVMSKFADSYEAARWVNAVVPPNVLVLTGLRHALLERPFVVNYDNQQLQKMLTVGGAQFAVLYLPIGPQDKPILARCRLLPFAGPKKFHLANRNPLGRQEQYELEVFRLTACAGK